MASYYIEHCIKFLMISSLFIIIIVIHINILVIRNNKHFFFVFLLLIIIICVGFSDYLIIKGTPTEVVEKIGNVLEFSIEGADSFAQVMGCVVEFDYKLYMIYSGADSNWVLNDNNTTLHLRPCLAVSDDNGNTWISVGPLFELEDNECMIHAQSIIKENDMFYLFYQCEYKPLDSNRTKFYIGVAESKDLTIWTDCGKIVSNEDYGIAGCLTNPCVIKCGNSYYMSVSEFMCKKQEFRIRLLKSDGIKNKWLDLGIIIDYNDAQHDWYAEGAWDSRLFYYKDKFWILFGGRSKTLYSSRKVLIKNYGFASTDDIEGNWKVQPEPFYCNKDLPVGGRSDVVIFADHIDVYCDMRTKYIWGAGDIRIVKFRIKDEYFNK